MTKRKPSKLPAALPTMDDLDNALNTFAPLPAASKSAIEKKPAHPQQSTKVQSKPKRSRKKAIKIVKQQNSKDNNKKGIMVYLDTDALMRLDITQVGLKHRFSQIGDHGLSRSALIEYAIVMMLDEYEQLDGDSQLIKLLTAR